MIRPRALVGALGALALGTSACTAAGSHPATGAPHVAGGPAAVRAGAARASLLTSKAFASSWHARGTVQVVKAVAAPSGTARHLDTCLGLARSLAVAPVSATGPVFSSGSGSITVTEQVQVYPQPAEAARAFRANTGAHAARCVAHVLGPGLRSQLRASLPKNAHLGALAVHALGGPIPAQLLRASASAATIRIEVPVAVGATHLVARTDTLVLRHGRDLATVTVLYTSRSHLGGLEGQLALRAFAALRT